MMSLFWFLYLLFLLVHIVRGTAPKPVSPSLAEMVERIESSHMQRLLRDHDQEVWDFRIRLEKNWEDIRL